MEHLKNIVVMQRSYAKTSGFIETVALVEDALRMNASSPVRHDVGLARDFQMRPVVSTDKRIVVRLVRTPQGVRSSIADNGVGVPAANLVRVFNHGFTTRKDGHGFGLHSGALAAKEPGGSLTVQSEGSGHGATFTLELPSKPEGLAA